MFVSKENEIDISAITGHYCSVPIISSFLTWAGFFWQDGMRFNASEIFLKIHLVLKNRMGKDKNQSHRCLYSSRKGCTLCYAMTLSLMDLVVTFGIRTINIQCCVLFVVYARYRILYCYADCHYPECHGAFYGTLLCWLLS